MGNYLKKKMLTTVKQNNLSKRAILTAYQADVKKGDVVKKDENVEVKHSRSGSFSLPRPFNNLFKKSDNMEETGVKTENSDVKKVEAETYKKAEMTKEPLNNINVQPGERYKLDGRFLDGKGMTFPSDTKVTIFAKRKRSKDEGGNIFKRKRTITEQDLNAAAAA